MSGEILVNLCARPGLYLRLKAPGSCSVGTSDHEESTLDRPCTAGSASGWGFFVLGLLKGLWTVLWWTFTLRKPGREGKAEASTGTETLEKTCMQCGKAEDAEIPGRCWSPRRECSKKRQVSATPERHPGREWVQESPGRSPEARQAQTRILEAMVQRAQPGFTRHAPPWWSGTRPNAATWIPHSMSTKRA